MNGEIIKGSELSYAINKRNCDASLTDEEKVLRHELMHLVSDLILLAETQGEDVLRASTATMLVEGDEGLLQINLLGEKGWVGSATSASADLSFNRPRFISLNSCMQSVFILTMFSGGAWFALFSYSEQRANFALILMRMSPSSTNGS